MTVCEFHIAEMIFLRSYELTYITVISLISSEITFPLKRSFLWEVSHIIIFRQPSLDSF